MVARRLKHGQKAAIGRLEGARTGQPELRDVSVRPEDDPASHSQEVDLRVGKYL